MPKRHTHPKQQAGDFVGLPGLHAQRVCPGALRRRACTSAATTAGATDTLPHHARPRMTPPRGASESRALTARQVAACGNGRCKHSAYNAAIATCRASLQLFQRSLRRHGADAGFMAVSHVIQCCVALRQQRAAGSDEKVRARRLIAYQGAGHTCIGCKLVTAAAVAETPKAQGQDTAGATLAPTPSA